MRTIALGFHICCYLLGVSALGQPGIDPKTPLSNLMVDQWTSDNGLVSNNLTSVHQDREGFLWVTSYNGAAKFDGAKFVLYDKEELPWLNSSAFYQIREDSLGNLWFATQASGVLQYRDRHFYSYGKELGLPNSIRCVFADSDGRIWAGSNQKGLFVMELPDSAFRQVEYASLQKGSILDIKQDIYGHIWVGTQGQGAAYFKDNDFHTLTLKDGLSNQVVEAVYPAVDGKIYLATDEGINVFNDGEIRQLDFLPYHQINDIQIDSYGTMWTATETGLGKMNQALGIEEFLSPQAGLKARQITSLAFDREGSLWLSTEKNGLVRLRPGRFNNYSTADGLAYEKVNIIREFGGKMWVGTDDGRINIVDGNGISELQIKTSLDNLGIRDICFDSQGIMWIGSYKGLLRYENGVEKLYGIKDGLPSVSIRRIHQNQQGELLLATKTHGVIVVGPEGDMRTYDINNSLEANYVLSLAEASDGTIYIGTHSGGVTVLTPDGSSKTVSIEDDPSGILFFNVHVDENDVPWMITNVGLYRYKNGKFRKAVFEDRLNTETFFDMIVDDLGNGWLTSPDGVIRFSIEELEEQMEGRIPIVETQLYDNLDGMLSKECTAATPSLKSSTGEIWIPTFGGISIIYPKAVGTSKYISPVYITDVNIDNESQLLGGRIVAPPGSMRYAFDFTSLSLTSPERVAFKFKLENFDPDWIETINIREAAYTNLAPGKYTFRVRGSNSDHFWNPQEASLTFTVRPHFYQTIWFYFIAGLGVLLAFGGIYKWRVSDINRRNRELEKLNNELDRFVYSASHDLRAPLASVLGLVAVAKSERDIVSKDECLSMIENSVDKLDGFISDIIDYSRNSRSTLEVVKVDFETLVKEAFEDLKYLDKGHTIDKRLRVRQSQEFTTDRRRLKVILNNLISNAIRYHNLKVNKPYLEVNVVYDGGFALIEVVDNGRGIEKRHQSQIFNMFYQASHDSSGSGLGLYIVKETVNRLKGRIDVISEPSKGTRFKIKLPPLKVA